MQLEKYFRITGNLEWSWTLRYVYVTFIKQLNLKLILYTYFYMVFSKLHHHYLLVNATILGRDPRISIGYLLILYRRAEVFVSRIANIPIHWPSNKTWALLASSNYQRFRVDDNDVLSSFTIREPISKRNRGSNWVIRWWFRENPSIRWWAKEEDLQ